MVPSCGVVAVWRRDSGLGAIVSVCLEGLRSLDAVGLVVCLVACMVGGTRSSCIACIGQKHDSRDRPKKVWLDSLSHRIYAAIRVRIPAGRIKTSLNKYVLPTIWEYPDFSDS